MYLIYLDESGNTWFDLKNTDQPIHFISWIAVHDSLISTIDKQINALYPLFAPFSQNFDFEFHWIDIAWWRESFKKFTIEQRLQAIKALVDIFVNNKLVFFSYGINKLAHADQYKYPFHPHNVTFARLIETIEDFLRTKKEQWLIIMDKTENMEQVIINDFQQYKRQWIWYWGWKTEIKFLIDTVYYTESYNSNLLQLSDILWYIYSIFHTFQYVWWKSPNYVKQSLFNYIKVIENQSYKNYIFGLNFKNWERIKQKDSDI